MAIRSGCGRDEQSETEAEDDGGAPSATAGIAQPAGRQENCVISFCVSWQRAATLFRPGPGGDLVPPLPRLALFFTQFFFLRVHEGDCARAGEMARVMADLH